MDNIQCQGMMSDNIDNYIILLLFISTINIIYNVLYLDSFSSRIPLFISRDRRTRFLVKYLLTKCFTF